MKKYIFLFIVNFIKIYSFAQTQVPSLQTVCTTAMQSTAGNNVICYTIGEMLLVKTEQNNGLVITQGIMQPLTFIADIIYECFNKTEVTVSPNPAPGVFSLKLNLFQKGLIKTQLFDASGRLIQTKEFVYNTFSITPYNIKHLANGMYFLQLYFTEVGSTKPKKCIYTIQKN